MEYGTKNTAQIYIKGSCKNASQVRLAQFCISTFIYVHKISFGD